MLVYQRRGLRTLLVVFTVLVLVSIGYTPTSQAQSPPLPPNNPKRGLIYDGLERDVAGRCRGMYLVKATGSCTHGPDPAPAGVDITQKEPPPVRPEAVTTTFTQCFGDGVSGYRTQVIYARASNVPDRYSTYLATFIQAAGEADSIYNNSAAETGGERHISFVTDASCNLVVPNVTLSTTGDDNFSNTISQLKAKGYNRTDRKYMVFVDANVYCGIGEIKNDDRLTIDNSNNSGPSFGRMDTRCWGGSGAAHEHMHNLGGVQHSAPHASGGWHCVDEYDIMCYSDEPYHPSMQYLCPDAAHEGRFDCNHDDYFHTSPPAGSYLATHWNAAQSRFLFSGTGTLIGTVRDAWTGQPIAGAWVDAVGPTALSVQTNASGQYSMNLPSGTYRVAGSKFGEYYAQEVSGVVVSSNTTPTQDFSLEPIDPSSYNLVGTVWDAEAGTPVAGVQITAYGPAHRSTTTDANGRYGLNLPSGSYTIYVSPGTKYYGPTPQGVVINSGTTVTLDFGLEPVNNCGRYC